MAKSPDTTPPASFRDSLSGPQVNPQVNPQAAPEIVDKDAAPARPHRSPADRTPANKGSAAAKTDSAPPEPRKPDPTRYGDWEKNGRCIDF